MIWPLDYRYRYDTWPYGNQITGHCDWCHSMQTQVVVMHELHETSDLVEILCAEHLIQQPWNYR